MANYDWTEYQQRTWANRFPEGVRGLEAWRQQRSLEEPPYQLMEERTRITKRPPKPCLFVSHRQQDVAEAKRIAYIACQEGFDYWLDVLDPTLSLPPSIISTSGPSPRQTAAAVAAVVEMGLLNSTHVMAIITPNTKGSQWVPYEYGRVKDPMPITLQAACWIDVTWVPSVIPEYLYLGVITRSEADVEAWLRSERQRYGLRGEPDICHWHDAIPARLQS
jgi:hypothetical protein